MSKRVEVLLEATDTAVIEIDDSLAGNAEGHRSFSNIGEREEGLEQGQALRARLGEMN